MKKYIILSIAVCFSFLSNAQSFDKIIDGYSDNDQLSKMILTSDVMRIFAQNYSQRKIIDKIDKVNVYLFNDNILLSKDEVKTIKSELKNDGLELLINVRDKDLKLDIYVAESNDIIKHLFMIVLTGSNQQIIADMKCNLTFDDFKELELNFEGAENLKRIAKNL